MSEILSIGSAVAGPLPGRTELLRQDPPATTTVDESPIVSSRFDAELQRILAQSSFRVARARAIAAEIQRGDFETPERIRGTVDRLLDLLA
jgi:hypothetical protein